MEGLTDPNDQCNYDGITNCTVECFYGRRIFAHSVHDLGARHVSNPYVYFLYKNVEQGIPFNRVRELCNEVEFHPMTPIADRTQVPHLIWELMECAIQSGNFSFDMMRIDALTKTPYAIQGIICFKEMVATANHTESPDHSNPTTELISTPVPSSSSSSCFESSTMVKSQTRGWIPINQLQIGEFVLSHCQMQNCFYSKVTHKGRDIQKKFGTNYIQIFISNGLSLKLSPTHILPRIAKGGQIQYVWASKVTISISILFY